MILSLFIYTFTAIVLYLLGKNIAVKQAYYTYNLNMQTKFWSVNMICIIFIFAFITGARYNVGVDHLSYLDFYIDMQNQGWINRLSLEPGFTLVMKLFSDLGLHYFFFFAFWGIIQIFCFYYAFKDDKFIFPYIGPIIMLTPLFLTWMNGIRQSVVCCIIVLLVRFIEKRKLIYFIIGLIICSFIHKSVFIFLPVYFIYGKSLYFKKNWKNIIFLIICAVFGSKYNFSSLLHSGNFLFELLGYDNYYENVDNIIEDTREMSWGPVRIILFLSEILVIWYYPKIKLYFKGSKRIDFYFTISFIGTCLYNLFVLSGIIFTRPLMYLTIFSYVMKIYTLYVLNKTGNTKDFIIFSFITLSYIYISLFKLWYSGIEDSVVYYKFFF